MKTSRNQSMDATNNCEAYMSKIFRKEKSQNLTTGTKQSGNVSKTKSNVYKPTVKTKLPGKSQNTNQISGRGCSTCSAEGNMSSPKEINIGNSALEISTKLKPRSRSNAAGDREPWGKLLQSANNENSSKFSDFDPLRTLHFLGKELQQKLKTDLPNDNNLQQILTDMQHALTRVPPEVASTINYNYSSENVLRKSSSSNALLRSNRIEEKIRKTKVNKSCQTIQKFEDAEIIQKVMEGSTKKLESSCRQMEMICGRLKSEKEDLEEQLKTEQENVKFLKKRVGDLEVQTDQLVSVTIRKLEEEKNELQIQVNKLTDVVDSQSVHTSYELKSVTQELKQVQKKAEQECSKLKHQLALATMEKEKYIAILTVRDKQISEIRSEMSQLQDVVNEQLIDIHNTALEELPSTNFSDEIGLSNKQSVNDLIKDEGSMNFIQKNSNSFQDLPSEEPNSNNSLFVGSGAQNIPKKKHSIRNMFEELRKQAFEVASINSKS